VTVHKILLAMVGAMVFTGAVRGAPVVSGTQPVLNGQALLSALRDGDERRASILIGQRIGVNARDSNGVTPLMIAAHSGLIDVVRRLLDAGAKPNLLCADGLGPLQISVGIHDSDAALLLLAHGANPNARRVNGETALMTAARTGQLEVMRQMIARGAHVNAHEDRFYQTALMWSAGHPEQVTLLLENRANFRAKTRIVSVTHTLYKSRAASGTDWEDEGTDVAREGGLSALFFAIQHDDLESVRELLEAGAPVDERAADGSTPLIRALYKWDAVPSESVSSPRAPIFAPNFDIANYLLDQGASATAMNSLGYTPLHGAVLALLPGASSWVVAGYNLPLPPANARVEPQAVLALMTRLLSLGADPNAATRYSLTGPVGLIRVDPTVGGSSPLHIAAYAHHSEAVRLLLDRGGNPNLSRPDGHTALSLAVQANDLPTAALLVADGADPMRLYDPTDMIDDFVKSAGAGTSISRAPRLHETLLHIAAVAGAADVVPFLAAHGISTNAENDRGETALAMAETEELRRYALQTQETVTHPANPHAVRSTATSDAIRHAMTTGPVLSDSVPTS
jgi:uncharacterized protein